MVLQNRVTAMGSESSSARTAAMSAREKSAGAAAEGLLIMNSMLLTKSSYIYIKRERERECVCATNIYVSNTNYSK